MSMESNKIFSVKLVRRALAQINGDEEALSTCLEHPYNCQYEHHQ